jgi:hypothetical protein
VELSALALRGMAARRQWSGGGVDTRDPVLTLTRDREAAESAGGKVGWCRLNGAQQQGGPSVEGGIW